MSSLRSITREIKVGLNTCIITISLSLDEAGKVVICANQINGRFQYAFSLKKTPLQLEKMHSRWFEFIVVYLVRIIDLIYGKNMRVCGPDPASAAGKVRDIWYPATKHRFFRVRAGVDVLTDLCCSFSQERTYASSVYVDDTIGERTLAYETIHCSLHERANRHSKDRRCRSAIRKARRSRRSRRNRPGHQSPNRPAASRT